MSEMKQGEQALLDGACRFDEQALAEIYDRYSPGIYRYAMRLLGEAGQAEECVAETFSRFLVSLSRGSGPRQALKAYLYRIAHNWITDSFRRQPPPLALEPEWKASSDHEPSQAVSRELERQEVRAALSRLTEDQRQVIVLKFLEGWSNDEIARALEKPVGAVKSLQHRGLDALRRILWKENEEVL